MQACNAMLAHAARHDAGKVSQVQTDVDAHAVKSHPAPHAHADGCYLVLPAVAHHPDADPAFAPLALDVELRQGADEPLLEVMDKGAHVGLALLQVQHH